MTADTWWTQANAAWIEAIALIGILIADFFLVLFALQERKEAREERRHAEVARQRSEVTCAGVTSVLHSLSNEQLYANLWAGHFRRAGFAFEKNLLTQLPEYLRIKCEAFADAINAPIAPEAHQKARFLLVFRFPYPKYDAVLADIERLHFETLVWDESGKPVNFSRD